MGETADFTNEHGWDDYEAYWDYRDGRIDNEEAYDRGVIDEFGSEIDPAIDIDFWGF